MSSSASSISQAKPYGKHDLPAMHIQIFTHKDRVISIKQKIKQVHTITKQSFSYKADKIANSRENFDMAQKYIITAKPCAEKVEPYLPSLENYYSAVASNFLSISQCGVWYDRPHWRRCSSTLQFCVIME